MTSKVTPVLGKFKKKDKKCPRCQHTWCGHEEKETDVNIALALVDLAYKDKYDHALLISNDSDLSPAIRMVRSNFPNKTITTVVPPNRMHSNELIQASNSKAKITVDQLERCLLQEAFYDVGGNIVAMRPIEYMPKIKAF